MAGQRGVDEDGRLGCLLRLVQFITDRLGEVGNRTVDWMGLENHAIGQLCIDGEVGGVDVRRLCGQKREGRLWSCQHIEHGNSQLCLQRPTTYR